MGKPKVRVLTGCPGCAMCTGNAFTGMGRGAGRVSVDVATFGISRLARSTCKACGHPMSEHNREQRQPAPAVPLPPPAPVAPPSLPAGWYPDPTDSRALCWWDGRQWRPETKHYPSAPR